MKKIFAILLCLLSVAILVCCKNKPTIVTPQTTTVTVQFVVSERYQDIAAPQDLVLDAGEEGGEIPFPEDAVPNSVFNNLQWFYDEQLTLPYDPSAKVEEDTVLYLGETPKSFAITYRLDESLTYVGEFPTSYTYGEEPIALPKVDSVGYAPYPSWYCVETDSIVYAVPTTVGGNLTLLSPDPLSYTIHYNSGLTDVSMEDVDNPNPATITVKNEPIELQPLTYRGQTSTGWQLVSRTTQRQAVIDGVTYTEGDTVDTITFQLAYSGKFALKAKWN